MVEVLRGLLRVGLEERGASSFGIGFEELGLHDDDDE